MGRTTVATTERLVTIRPLIPSRRTGGQGSILTNVLCNIAALSNDIHQYGSWPSASSPPARA